MGALDGVVVLDVTTARSGPTCVRQLSDLGADVIQVCDPNRAQIGGSDGHNLHRGKRSVVLDVRTDAGREAFLRLCERADVVVENGKPGAVDRLGIGPGAVAMRNPRVVYASISGFGQTGPAAERAGVDQIAQGMSGIMSVTGPPGTGPWRTGIAISDTVAGTFLAQAVLAALFARERTGRGQWVHTSLLETMVNLMDFQACRWLSDGVVPAQEGNEHPTFVPMGCYRTADGWVNVAPLTRLGPFFDAIGAPGVLADERFATGSARSRHRAALNAVIDAALARESTAHWVALLAPLGIPVGPVYGMDEVFADAQVQHLGLHHDVGGRAVLRHPVTFTGTPTAVQGPPPAPGAHTVEVLAWAGYTPDDIDALVASGAASTSGTAGDWL
jgi:crotonobetainyl-CoA:carnitine CoA-transferase CaiB-like acyl-CoA transferase